MFHRLYPRPFTRINEAWNPLAGLDSSPGVPYCDKIITGSSNQFHTDENFCEFYNHVAIDIVSETVFNYPHPQITEKTYRPILQKRMFIIVGPPDSLVLLKNHGFKTFDPWICEDYDVIKDPLVRMTAILAEIDRLTDLPLDTIQDYMLKCNSIIEYNRKHLIHEHQTMPDRFAKLLEEI
tara:strand:+ start:1165 stop:1704 length:540 start_codon:yes stop_codon:yes gene_type:complete